MHKKQVEYDRKSREARIKRGEVNVRVWVPKDKAATLRQYAAELRDACSSADK